MLRPAETSPQVRLQRISPEVYPHDSHKNSSAAWSLLANEVWNEQTLVEIGKI